MISKTINWYVNIYTSRKKNEIEEQTWSFIFNQVDHLFSRLLKVKSIEKNYTIKHEKNFVEVSESLTGNRSENNLDRENNYAGCSNWLLECQNFLQYCSLCLSVLHNDFDSLTKLFSDLAKFLDTSAKSFFSCRELR